MEEKKYPGSSYQNLFDYLTKEHGLTLLESEMNDLIHIVHKFHGRGAVWVKASERLPENDMFEDYPKEYCLKCKSDGSRGAVEYHQGNVDDIQYMVKCGPYDVIWWLDEKFPSEQPVAHKELQDVVDNCVEELQKAKRITGLVLQSRSRLWNDYAKLKAAVGQPAYTEQERLDTRVALRILLKLFRNGKLSEQQEKCCADAEAILKQYSNGRTILKEKPSPWISADTKPEHNVGVLVFIPGEDNHITSGMWDISNEWVLLDEYRTPEKEVTHWMRLPAFPEGYTLNEISNELVDALKKVAKEELSKREQPAAGREEDAVAFAEWLNKHYHQCEITDLWKESARTSQGRYTTAQLYELFKQQKEK